MAITFGMIRKKSLMKQPLVSVLMCTRNAADFVSAALNSIFHQTYSKFETIVIDDASTDGTWVRLSRFHDRRLIILKNNTSLGISASLNRGLRLTKGTYIARMDADDISDPTRFKAQVDFLTTHTAVGVVGTWVRLINAEEQEQGYKKFPVSEREIKHMLPYTNPLIHPTVMVRRALFEKYGLYNSEYDGAEDYELWLRWSKYTQFANIGQVLLNYRLHDRSVSFNETSRLNFAYAKVQVKKIFEYGYPWWHLLFALKSILSGLTPKFISQQIYRKFFGYP